MDLFTLEKIEVNLTDYRGREKLSQYAELQRGDIVVADRAYGTIKSIEHALSKGCDYVLRLRVKASNLYEASGKQTELAEKNQENETRDSKELNLHYKSHGKLNPFRLCVQKDKSKNPTVRNGGQHSAVHRRRVRVVHCRDSRVNLWREPLQAHAAQSRRRNPLHLISQDGGGVRGWVDGARECETYIGTKASRKGVFQLAFLSRVH